MMVEMSESHTREMIELRDLLAEKIINLEETQMKAIET